VVEYQYRAKPCKVKGYGRWGLPDVQRMDSHQEGALSMLLIRNGIRHQPHVEYEVIDRNGDEHIYEVDFDFYRPHKLKGLSYPVSALEYKGVMSDHDKDRMDWWEFRTDRNMYIVHGTSLVKYWDESGMKDTQYENGGLEKQVRIDNDEDNGGIDDKV